MLPNTALAIILEAPATCPAAPLLQDTQAQVILQEQLAEVTATLGRQVKEVRNSWADAPRVLGVELLMHQASTPTGPRAVDGSPEPISFLAPTLLRGKHAWW